MKRRYRPRKEFKFWLYHDLQEDIELMSYIKFLVHTRKFATTVRNGLRLMWSLGQGDLSVLFELFPTLRSQFAPDNSTLIEEFRQLLQQNRAESAVDVPGAKLLNAPKKLLPLLDDGDDGDDDDADTLVLKKSSSAAPDFFTSMLQL